MADSSVVLTQDGELHIVGGLTAMAAAVPERRERELGHGRGKSRGERVGLGCGVLLAGVRQRRGPGVVVARRGRRAGAAELLCSVATAKKMTVLRFGPWQKIFHHGQVLRYLQTGPFLF